MLYGKRERHKEEIIHAHKKCTQIYIATHWKINRTYNIKQKDMKKEIYSKSKKKNRGLC